MRQLEQQAAGRAAQQGVGVPAARIARRHALLAGTALLAAGAAPPRPASAALAQFPAAELRNRYVLVRAGESVAQMQDRTFTNPVWKTSMANGLSEAGKDQVLQQTLPALRRLGMCVDGGCWLWPSITQNAYQTAELLAYKLDVGRSRINPEYTFLDQRGLGAFEGLRFATAYGQLHEGDALDPGWRPPPNTDGTPNESVADVLARVRQVLSVTETQYTGADIAFISPDSENLSVLQAAVLGVDLRRHEVYSLAPGEARLLRLAEEGFDAAPRQFACRRPPACN